LNQTLGEFAERMGEMGDEGRKLSFLEKAVRLIPGYKGYKRKEERRDNDQLLRVMLVDRLDKIRGSVNEVLAALRGPDALEAVTDIDRLLKRLEKATDEVRFADRGYRGWFDVHKVQEDELDRLYEFDAALAENIAAIEEAMKALSTAAGLGGPIKSQVEGIIDLLLRFSEKMTSRSDLMIDLEKNRPID
jgi:hypothetical protein